MSPKTARRPPGYIPAVVSTIGAGIDGLFIELRQRNGSWDTINPLNYPRLSMDLNRNAAKVDAVTGRGMHR